MPVPKRAVVLAAILRQPLTKGKTWDELKFEGCDGIATHEIDESVTLSSINWELIRKHTSFNQVLASDAHLCALSFGHHHDARRCRVIA
jgi:hypothetical protein